MSDTGQGFYDIIIKKLNHNLNDLQRKYDDSLVKIQNLQSDIVKLEAELEQYKPKQNEQDEQDFKELK